MKSFKPMMGATQADEAAMALPQRPGERLQLKGERGIMNNLRIALTVSAICIGGITAPVTVSAADEQSMMTRHGIRSEQLQKELAQLRRATSRYQDVKKALQDGYVGPGPFVPFMGLHYLQPNLLGDGAIDIYRPEALVYDSNDPQQKTHNLGAVEYIIVDPEGLIPPSELPILFTGQGAGDWHYVDEVGVWTLHVWIWLDNPAGLFNPTNPRVGPGT